MDWLDLLAVQGTQSLLQRHSSKALILQCSTFFIPVSSKANLLTLLVGKQSFLQVPSKEGGQLTQKTQTP